MTAAMPYAVMSCLK